MTSDTEKLQTFPIEQINPIAKAIDCLLHRTRDIRACTAQFIPEAVRLHNQRVKKIQDKLEEGEKLLASSNEADRVQGISDTIKAFRAVNRVSNSRTPEVLETSLFIGMFSSFDAFIGHLLTAIYKKKPELIKSFGKEVTVSEVCKYASIDDFLDSMLEGMIETFRRKSYSEQLIELESSFNIPLRKFSRWPSFVEAAQRRNLFTHCDGIVSAQYLNICSKEGYSFTHPICEGDRLELGPDYFLPTCELVMEAGLKLGQTLWRKIFPDEIDEADKHLNDAIYDALHFENWRRAQIYGEFAISDSVSKKSSDLHKKMFISNLAIAYKFGDESDKSRKLLEGTDWSASLNEFRLCEAVLSERYDDASMIMKQIG